MADPALGPLCTAEVWRRKGPALLRRLRCLAQRCGRRENAEDSPTRRRPFRRLIFHGVLGVFGISSPPRARARDVGRQRAGVSPAFPSALPRRLARRSHRRGLGVADAVFPPGASARLARHAGSWSRSCWNPPSSQAFNQLIKKGASSARVRVRNARARARPKHWQWWSMRGDDRDGPKPESIADTNRNPFWTRNSSGPDGPIFIDGGTVWTSPFSSPNVPIRSITATLL